MVLDPEEEEVYWIEWWRYVFGGSLEALPLNPENMRKISAGNVWKESEWYSMSKDLSISGKLGPWAEYLWGGRNEMGPSGHRTPSLPHLWAERTRIQITLPSACCACILLGTNPHSSREKYCCCPILQLGKVRHRSGNLPKITQLARADLGLQIQAV